MKFKCQEGIEYSSTLLFLVLFDFMEKFLMKGWMRLSKFKRRPMAAAVLAAILFASGISGCQKGENRIESQETAAQAASETKGKGPGDGKTEAGMDVEAKDSVIVVMGPSSEPEAGFDPAYGWGAGEHVHEPLIQSTLTVTTKDLRIDYDLATDMKVSEDGLTWTVTIRDDVKFTDGEALDAGMWRLRIIRSGTPAL